MSASAGRSASTTIERSGRFRIPAERAGVFRVAISVQGFAPYRFRVTLPTSRTLRLPVIHLEPATYYRVRFVSPAGEPIAAPFIRQLSFDGSGAPLLEASDAPTIEPDADGATRIGPLSHGTTTQALDTPGYGQTRLPNVSVTGAAPLLDGGTIVIQPGSTLHVDVLDASGEPVPDHVVLLEDLLPLSPLRFPILTTNAEGRATFERLAAGRYRLRTATLERCATRISRSRGPSRCPPRAPPTFASSLRAQRRFGFRRRLARRRVSWSRPNRTTRRPRRRRSWRDGECRP